MVTFLVVLLMVYIFPNLLGLLESAIMLRTSTLEINVSNFIVGGSCIRLYDGPHLKAPHFRWFGPDLLVCCSLMNP